MARLTSPRVIAYSRGTTAHFIPAIGPTPFVDVKSVLWTMWAYGWQNTSTSGWPLEYRPALQFSSDGIEWSTSNIHELGSGYLDPQAVGAGSPDKWLYGDGYESIEAGMSPPPNVYRYVRYGAMVRRPSGSVTVFGKFQLIIDTRE